MILPQFQSKLPRNPFASNNLEGGIYPKPLEVALHYKYLQINSSNEVACIVLDIDKPNAAFLWEDVMSCLPPHMIVTNPVNGHAHYYYLLKRSVHKNASSNKKVIAYLDAIVAALTLKLGADPCYNGVTAKNPYHKAWVAQFFGHDTYELEDFVIYGDLDLKDARKNVRAKKAANAAVGVGSRNTELFDSVRIVAYKLIKDYRGGSVESWRNAVLNAAVELNTFEQPLSYNEVKGVAKSVAKGIWDCMSEHQPSFIEKQRILGKRSGIARKAKTFNQRVAAWTMHHDMKMKYDDIATELNVSKRTVMRWIKEAKQADNDDTLRGDTNQIKIEGSSAAQERIAEVQEASSTNSTNKFCGVSGLVCVFNPYIGTYIKYRPYLCQC